MDNLENEEPQCPNCGRTTIRGAPDDENAWYCPECNVVITRANYGDESEDALNSDGREDDGEWRE